jgi:hypothetical protein
MGGQTGLETGATAMDLMGTERSDVLANRRFFGGRGNDVFSERCGRRVPESLGTVCEKEVGGGECGGH